MVEDATDKLSSAESVMSRFVSCGVRQGGILSPHLFAIYLDNVVKKVSDSKNGCYIKGICMSILLYADDISCAFGHSSSRTVNRINVA